MTINYSMSHSENISLPCPKMINFTELTPNMTFHVAIVWYLETVLPCIWMYSGRFYYSIRLNLWSGSRINSDINFSFFLGLPGTPVLNVSGDSVCFSSHSYYPIDYYSIEITDLVGDKQALNETKQCISLSGSSFPLECSPYQVLVNAHNQVGNSNSSSVTFKGMEHSNFDC